MGHLLLLGRIVLTSGTLLAQELCMCVYLPGQVHLKSHICAQKLVIMVSQVLTIMGTLQVLFHENVKL